MPALPLGVQRFHVLEGAVGGGGEVGVTGGEQVKDARVEIDVLDLQLLAALPGGALEAEGLLRWRQRGGGGRATVLEAECRQLDALRGGAAVHAQLQVLSVIISHGELMGHADGQRKVTAQLAHHHRYTDVGGVQLNVATGQLFQHHEAARLTGATYNSAVHECRWQVICHRLVHLLLCALLIRFEDDSDLKKKKRSSNMVSYSCVQTSFRFFVFSMCVFSIHDTETKLSGISPFLPDVWINY